MTMTMLEARFAQRAGLGPERHIRCCRPHVPNGLCGQAAPLNRKPEMGIPDCTMCEAMWHDHHGLVCAKDSGGWGE